MLVTAGHHQLILCHLNHGLRGRESGQDAVFIRRLARRYELPCEIAKADVAGMAKAQRISLEMAGRNARYDFLQRMAVKHEAARIYLAHHADDQAETILANLCRGTGIGGLKGMLAETSGGPVLCRPLLGMPRQEIEAYIETHGLDYREDSSNVSPAHRRNRLRHEVLPLLNQVYQREVAPLIVRLGRQAARDDGCLWEQAMEFVSAAGAIESDGSLRAGQELRSLHPAVLSRVLHHWLGYVLGLPGMDAVIMDAVLSMLHPGGPAKINLPENRHLRRKAGRMWVEGA
ncbi:tRNA(Ile)-lysidine synthase [Prosthecobacter fusiformis]|uniref:tRNA(Ile)-lysidine synthase n=2 Tax=Prosthecobacter fusiformis TaxID=48464 RepID=A0A4R7SNG8_9BACT|nr:tRNA(Ile)-lysidine synthase [Prosthecobacter fusiformis]